jgi:hypothetical protein
MALRVIAEDEESEEHFEGRQFMIESFSDVIRIAKILFTFLSRFDWETLSEIYKFDNLSNNVPSRMRFDQCCYAQRPSVFGRQVQCLLPLERMNRIYCNSLRGPRKTDGNAGRAIRQMRDARYQKTSSRQPSVVSTHILGTVLYVTRRPAR